MKRVREGIAPAYLFAALILGGSVQSVIGVALLQLSGIAILAWAALDRTPQDWTKTGRSLFLLAIGLVALVIVQLVPLPSAVWSALPGREPIVDGYRILGLPLPALPISLAPYDSGKTLLTLIPPLAMLAAVLRMRAYRTAWLAAALVFGTICGVMLGVLQVASSAPQTSGWYLYDRTNHGLAVGFFANANHMATLLLMTVPFLAALAASAGQRNNRQKGGAVIAVTASAMLIVVVGVALNSSFAGYSLLIPVALFSSLLLLKRSGRTIPWVVGTAVLVGLTGAALLVLAPQTRLTYQTDLAGSVSTRGEIFATTTQAIGDHFPVGSGLGTYADAYKLYEDGGSVDPRGVVNHAHNDYLEVAMELGLGGIVLLAAFLAAWAVAAVKAWRSESGPFTRAATIASAAVLLHSVVDYPLRTAAITVVFAMCVGLMARGRRKAKPDAGDLWETRHLGLN